MKRILQIRDSVAQSEWNGGGMPVPPSDAWTFVDVTDRPDAQVGMTYDAESDTFVAPPAPPYYGQTVSSRDFLLKFTAAERKAIRAAVKVDDDVADWYAIAQVPEPIRLKHPNTLAGLDFLVAKSLLSPARRDAITG